MKVMLLAAGEGTRFKPHTLTCPKPALPFLNVPLGFYSLELLQEIQVNEAVVNTYHLPKKIVSTFKPMESDLKSLRYSHESQLMGGGGGLWQAKEHFINEENFILMNADEIILPLQMGQLRKAYDFHCHNRALSTLLVIEHPEVGTKFGGVWLNSNNQVIGFGKTKPPQAERAYHFIGLQFLSKRIFNYLPDGESNILLNGVLPGIQSGETVQTYKIDAHWFETGNLSDYLQATEKCLHLLREKNPLLMSILKKHSPHSQLEKNSRGIFLTDAKTDIKMDQFRGFAVVGSEVQIQPETQIENCVIAAKTKVASVREIKNELLL